MITLETRVNGQLIGHVYITNQKTENNKGQTLYRFKYYQLGKKELLDSHLWHKREEGAEKLSWLVFKKIYKELQKNKQ